MMVKGLKCIGKGTFSTVYKKNANKVLIKTNDYTKECMSAYWFPKSQMFPTTKYVGECYDYKLYEQKYYTKVTSLKQSLLPKEYEWYQALRKMFSKLTYTRRSYDNYNVLYKAFSGLPSKFSHKRKVLLEALDAMADYGQDVCFEVSPRNVAVNNGKLVLLDCFFISSQLKKVGR